MFLKRIGRRGGGKKREVDRTGTLKIGKNSLWMATNAKLYSDLLQETFDRPAVSADIGKPSFLRHRYPTAGDFALTCSVIKTVVVCGHCLSSRDFALRI